MFGDRARTDWLSEFYNHPLITSLFPGNYVPGRTRNLPSYIPSGSFAIAVIDMVAGKAGMPAAAGAALRSEESILQSFETALVNLPAGSQMRGALQPLLRVSGGKLSSLEAEIERWFNNSMDRVSGWYKRRTQVIIWVIGLVMTVLMNVDTVAIVRYLNTSATARAVLMSRVEAFRQARADAGQNHVPGTTDMSDPLGWLQRQGGVPLGWVIRPTPPQTQEDFDRDWRRPPRTLPGWLLKLAGILFSAFAISLGAPFWFDLLNRFMIVRDTVKPGDKPIQKPT